MPDNIDAIRDGIGSMAGKAAAAGILILWLAGAYSLFAAEYSTVRLIPELAALGPDEKAYIVSGPEYELTQKALALIPARSSIYLLLEPDTAAAGFTTGKVRYYLYPRRIITAGSLSGLSGIRANDYVMFYMPAMLPHLDIAPVRAALRLEAVYDSTDAEGHRAIYRVAGAR